MSMGSSRIASTPRIQTTRFGLSFLTSTTVILANPQAQSSAFIPKLWTERVLRMSPPSVELGRNPRQRSQKPAASLTGLARHPSPNNSACDERSIPNSAAQHRFSALWCRKSQEAFFTCRIWMRGGCWLRQGQRRFGW